MEQQFFSIALWITLFGFLGLLFAGATKRIVVFENDIDLVLSFIPAAGPFVGWFVLESIVPAQYDVCHKGTDGEQYCHSDLAAAIAGDLFTKATLIIMLIVLCIVILKIFSNSIRSNGFFLGFLMGAFKIMCTAGLGAIILLAVWRFITGKSLKGSLLSGIMGGAAVWLLSNLVNGDEVRQRIN